MLCSLQMVPAAEPSLPGRDAVKRPGPLDPIVLEITMMVAMGAVVALVLWHGRGRWY